MGVYENIKQPIVSDNNLVWEEGSLHGINLPFLLLEDEVSTVDVLTDEVIALDKKSQYPKIDLEKENADLKARQDLMQRALDDLILGGMM
jgi:hypothetical protein